MTVKELKVWLEQLPDNANVRGYEGEGGSWIIVDDRVTGEELASVPTIDIRSI